MLLGVMPSEPPVMSRAATIDSSTTWPNASVTSAN